jgi:hypothetical protein
MEYRVVGSFRDAARAQECGRCGGGIDPARISSPAPGIRRRAPHEMRGAVPRAVGRHRRAVEHGRPASAWRWDWRLTRRASARGAAARHPDRLMGDLRASIAGMWAGYALRRGESREPVRRTPMAACW